MSPTATTVIARPAPAARSEDAAVEGVVPRTASSPRTPTAAARNRNDMRVLQRTRARVENEAALCEVGLSERAACERPFRDGAPCEQLPWEPPPWERPPPERVDVPRAGRP